MKYQGGCCSSSQDCPKLRQRKINTRDWFLKTEHTIEKLKRASWSRKFNFLSLSIYIVVKKILHGLFIDTIFVFYRGSRKSDIVSFIFIICLITY